jgi:hypothetical protein
MSEWRCRYSARGDREHCIPITPAGEKKQLYRLMKRVRRHFDTSSCVFASIAAKHCTRDAKILRRDAHDLVRPFKNPHDIWLSDDSDFLLPAGVKCRARHMSGCKSRRRNAPNVPVKPVEIFSRHRSLKRLPTLESDANRANRPSSDSRMGVARAHLAPGRGRSREGGRRSTGTEDGRQTTQLRRPIRNFGPPLSIIRRLRFRCRAWS